MFFALSDAALSTELTGRRAPSTATSWKFTGRAFAFGGSTRRKALNCAEAPTAICTDVVQRPRTILMPSLRSVRRAASQSPRINMGGPSRSVSSATSISESGWCAKVSRSIGLSIRGGSTTPRSAPPIALATGCGQGAMSNLGCIARAFGRAAFLPAVQMTPMRILDRHSPTPAGTRAGTSRCKKMPITSRWPSLGDSG